MGETPYEHLVGERLSIVLASEAPAHYWDPEP